jgi:HEAT repeat protein
MKKHPVSGNLSPGDVNKTSEQDRDRLLAQLFSSDWREREAAVEEIVALDDRNLAESVLNLVRKNSADLNALSGALKALAKVGRPLTAEMVELLGTTEDTDTRILIPIVLGELGDPSAAAGLIELVKDPNQNVNARFNAIEALGKLLVLEAVPTLKQYLSTGEPYLRYAAVVALGLIGSPDAEQDLLPLLEDEYLVEPAISALGQLGSSSAAAGITRWMNRMAQSNSCQVEMAVQALANIARRDHHPESVRDAFLLALDPQTVPCLTALMGDSSSTGPLYEDLAIVLSWSAQKYPQTAGIWAAFVRLLEDPKARPVAQEALKENPGLAAEELIAALQGPSGAVARAAASLLGEFGLHEAGPFLEQALEDGEEALAVQSAEALGRLGRKEAGDRLLAALAHPSMQVRRAAVTALAAIQPPGLIDQVMERTRSSDPRLREASLRLLALLDYKLGAATALRSLSDEDPEVRIAAVELLSHFQDPQAVPALAQALIDPDVNLRIAAARVVAAAAATTRAMPAEFAVPLLQRAAHDPNGWVRMHATRGLGNYPRSDVLLDLLDRLSDSFPPVRIAAVEALSGFPGEITRSALEPLLQDGNDEVREAAARVLRKGETRDL